MGDASGVVGQVGTLIALGAVALHLQVLEFDQLEKTLARADSQPPLVEVPGAGRGD